MKEKKKRRSITIPNGEVTKQTHERSTLRDREREGDCRLHVVFIQRDESSTMESFSANRPDAPSRCTYAVNGDKQQKCPHNLGIRYISRVKVRMLECFFFRQKSLRQKIYNNVLELIGDTPMVRVNRLSKEGGGEVQSV